MRPMLLPAALLALFLAASLPGAAQGTAIAAVPDEPGVVVLPDAPILQSVAADVDGDGRREVVRLVVGAGDAVLAEVWGQSTQGWQLRGDPVEVVPPSRVGLRIDRVYQETPVRLLVRHVAGVERVTVASQPHFEEIDVGEPCCLILHDLAIADGVALRRPVSGPSDFADVITVIDFDGDGTDELLSTESLPTAGQIEFAIEARVHRWVDGAFAPPTETRLPFGSGDSPFRLGDSDGLPGDEAAILSTIGPPGIFRIRLTEGDRLIQEAGRIVADQAVAVPLDGGRGIAVVGPVVGLMVAEWPPGEVVSAASAESLVTGATIVGTVAVNGQARLVVNQPATGAVHLLGLPDLLPPQGVTITRSPAAAVLAGAPLAPFSGPAAGWRRRRGAGHHPRRAPHPLARRRRSLRHVAGCHARRRRAARAGGGPRPDRAQSRAGGAPQPERRRRHARCAIRARPGVDEHRAARADPTARTGRCPRADAPRSRPPRRAQRHRRRPRRVRCRSGGTARLARGGGRLRPVGGADAHRRARYGQGRCPVHPADGGDGESALPGHPAGDDTGGSRAARTLGRARPDRGTARSS